MDKNEHDDDKPKVTVHFAQGAFDRFEGTEEELDELISAIMVMAELGEFDSDVIIMPTPEFTIDDLAGELSVDYKGNS